MSENLIYTVSSLLSKSLWEGLSVDDENTMGVYSDVISKLQLANPDEEKELSETMFYVVYGMGCGKTIGNHKERFKEILNILFDLPNQKEKWKGKMQKAFDEACESKNFGVAEVLLEWGLAEGDFLQLKEQAGLHLWHSVFSEKLKINPHQQEWVRNNPECLDLVYQSDEALKGYIRLCELGTKIVYEEPFEIQQSVTEQDVFEVVNEHLKLSKLVLDRNPSHEFPLLLWCKMCTIHGQKFMSSIDANHLLMLDQLDELKKEIQKKRYPGVGEEEFPTFFLNDLHELWVNRVSKLEKLATPQSHMVPYLFGGVIMRGMAGLSGTAARLYQFKRHEHYKKTDQEVVSAIYNLADTVVEKSILGPSTSEWWFQSMLKDVGVFMHQVLEGPSLLLTGDHEKVVLKNNMSAALLLTKQGSFNKKVLDVIEHLPVQENGLVSEFINAVNENLVMEWQERHSKYKKRNLVQSVKPVKSITNNNPNDTFKRF